MFDGFLNRSNKKDRESQNKDVQSNLSRTSNKEKGGGGFGNFLVGGMV